MDKSEFRINVFNAINTLDNSNGILNILRSYQKSVYRNSCLPEPFEKDLDFFLNDLSSKIINFILSSDMAKLSNERKKEISEIFGKILKGYMKILIHFIDIHYYNVFYDSVLKIFEVQCSFYSTTTKTAYFSGVQESPHYTSIILYLTSSNVLEKITTFFNKVQKPTFQYFNFLLNFLRITGKNYSPNNFKKCLDMTTGKIICICQDLEGNDLRDVDEKYIHNSLLQLNKLNKNQIADIIASTFIGIDIKFTKSSYLKKRFAGLSTIRNFLNQNANRRKQTCSLLYSEKVLEEVLKDFHHQLVSDFVGLMIEMIYQDFDETKNLCEFWEVCLNQHSSTIDIFFKGLFDLTRDLPENYISILFQKIGETKKFPDSCLSFLCKVSYRMNDNQKSKIYESLERFYFSNDYQTTSANLIISSLCYFIPSNQFFCQKIFEKALNMIENNSHLTLSLNLLMSSYNQIHSDNSDRYFDTVTAHISSENSIQFLPLLQQIIFRLNHCLSNEQFQKLLNVTIVHFTSLNSANVSKICEFYSRLLQRSSQIFNIDMLKFLFKTLCNLNPINQQVFTIIQSLFIDCNKYTKYENAYKNPYGTQTNYTNEELYGIDDLWNLLFRTNSKFWIKYLAKTESTNNIVNKCMSNYTNQASLSTLFYIIHSVEDSLNKELMDIPSNIYIDPEDTVTISITGEIQKRLCVSKFLSYNAVLHKIAYLLDRKFDYLAFEEDGRTIYNMDAQIKDGAEINVRCLYGYTNKICDEVDIASLPSRILMDEKYSSVLFGLLNDPQLGRFALKILNEIPTLDNEKVIFKEKKEIVEGECKYEFDWNNYLTLNNPLLLNYHLNIIGNNIASNNANWIKLFFETGGALKTLNLALSEDTYNFIVTNNCGKGYNIQNSLDKSNISSSSSNTEQNLTLSTNSSNNNTEKNSSSSLNNRSKDQNLNLSENEQDKTTNNNENKQNKTNENEQSKTNENEQDKVNENEQKLNKNENNMKSNDNGQNKPNFDIQKVWKTPDYSFNITYYLLLIRVARRILEVPCPQIAEELIKSFDSQTITNFSRLIITVGNQTQNVNLVSNMLYIFELLTRPKTIPSLEFSNFLPLLDITLFSPSEKIKNKILEIMQNLPPKSYQDALIPLLPKAFKMNSVDYFKLLYPVTLETNDPISIWNKLIDIILVQFVPSKSLSLLDQLKFTIPSTQLSKGIFNILNVLVDRISTQIKDAPGDVKIDEIPRISELFNFLVNEILLNTMKYFEITKELVNLLVNLLSKKPSLGKDVINRLKEVRLAKKSIKINSDFQPTMSSRSKYKGLRNLGATCYMASLLQQLFSIPIFRNSLLNLSVDSSEDDDKWLIELQYLFLKMLFFPSCDIDPSSFVKCWKGWDDRPINPREQQDAMEFLQMFLDRIIEKVPIIKSLFKGVILHHTDGVDCDFHQNNNEEYVNVSLEVKGHSNVSQSFETYRSPDRFDGNDKYHTDQFGLIDAIQTHRILTPSPQLVITLKRFEYNLSTMLREKVNSEYQFPTSLDLSPIMVDDSKRVMYELYGVVVHMGSAQGGHYVSHIKEDDGNWYLFNDKKVTQESLNSMLVASYGGSTTSQLWDNEAQTYITTTFDKGSAYLLFYRKTDFDFNSESLQTVSPVLLDRLLTEIKNQILYRLESSQEYLRFVSEICADSSFLLSFFEDSSFSIESISILSSKCIENCSLNPSFSSEILRNVDQHLSIILSSTIIPEVRHMYTNIIISAMNFSPIEESQQLISKFLTKVLDEPDTIIVYYEAFPNFFNVFEHYYNRFTDLKNDKTIDKDSKTAAVLSSEDSMVTLWINSFSAFILKCLKNPIICEDADFSTIFDILTSILRNNTEKAPLFDSIIQKNAILTFFCSNKNSESYTRLLVELIQCKYLCIDKINFVLNENADIYVTSRLFICCLADSTSSGEQYLRELIEFCNGKGSVYLFSFLQEVSSLALQFKNQVAQIFFAQSTTWINNWILHKAKEVRHTIFQVFKAFAEITFFGNNSANSKSIFGGIFKSILSTIPQLKQVTLNLLKMHESYKITRDEFLKQIPTEEYFYLLTWAVKSGSFYKEVSQNGQTFGNLCSSFGNYSSETPNLHLMYFISQTVNETNASEFFKDETLGLFLNGLNKIYMNDSNNETKTKLIAHFIRIIPDERSEELFNTKFFRKVIKYLLVNDIGIISRNKIKKNVKNLQNPESFAKSVFQMMQTSSSLNEICRISWIILKQIPSLSDAFESSGCRQFLWETIANQLPMIRTIPLLKGSGSTNRSSVPYIAKFTNHQSTVVFPAMKLLGVFNRCYSTHNKDKHGYFCGNYVDWLASQWEKTSIQFHSIFQVAIANIKLEFGQSGPYIFLSSLIQLNVKKFAESIFASSKIFHRAYSTNAAFSSTSYLYWGGIVLKTPLKAQKEAALFVVSLFDKIVANTSAQTEICNFMIEEFTSLLKGFAANQQIRIDALHILASKIEETIDILPKNDSKKLVGDINVVFSSSKDPSLFENGLSNLAISLFKIQKDKLNIGEWKTNAVKILAPKLKSILASVDDKKSKEIESGVDVLNILKFIYEIDKISNSKTILPLTKDELTSLLFLLKDKNSEIAVRIAELISKIVS